MSHPSPLRHKGDTWNESQNNLDPVTLRLVRRYTSAGLFNTTPTYHTNIAFTADGKYFVFARGTDDARTAVFKASVETGEITQLIDPVSGIGHWSVIQIKPRSQYADGEGISGPSMCLAPKSRWLAYYAGRSLRLVHLDTLEERTLLEDFGRDRMAGVISINPSETHVLFPSKPAHPDLAADREPSAHYNDMFHERPMFTQYIAIPLTGRASRIVYEDEGYGCSHCPHCPTDDDLVLIDRDMPGAIDRLATRAHLLRLSTGELTPLPPRNRHKYQTHVAWTWDGQHLLYHGRAAEGGWFIGVTDRQGQVVREWTFPNEYYGHVSAAPDRPAIIIDGNLTPDKLLWLYYNQEQPRLEIIAHHGTEWKTCPGQLPHPHAHSDASGRVIAFNVGCNGRTDVQTMQIQPPGEAVLKSVKL